MLFWMRSTWLFEKAQKQMRILLFCNSQIPQMFEFHADRFLYFQMQTLNADKYVIPFIEAVFKIQSGMRVLEIGAGEGGVLKAFVQRGCTGVAVELDADRVANGKQYLKDEIAGGKFSFITTDIYNVNPNDLAGAFDIIILKDVIEHIHDQQKLIQWLHQFIKPGGIVFFGFPPWQMPYGGHQQMGVKKFSRIPWLHLLPMSFYKAALKLFHEPQDNIDMLAEVKETGLSIERFERIVKHTQWAIALKKHFLINPIYEWKFGWKPRTQSSLVSNLPFFRNFVTTCVYYVLTSGGATATQATGSAGKTTTAS